MASDEKNTIRFAVGSIDEYRSAIWRLWVQGNDVYLAARVLTGFIKISLHKSGIWRLAWTDASGVKAQGSMDRVEERWQRPQEFRKGWTQGPAIIVPHSGIQSPFRHLPDTDKIRIVWSPVPKPGHQHYFTILFASPQAPNDSWQTVLRAGDVRLGMLNLRNGDKVILCRREVAMQAKQIAFVIPFVQDMRINYDTEIPEVYGASVYSSGTDDEGHPYLLDMALGWENVRVS
jgi:hypothetical protein